MLNSHVNFDASQKFDAGLVMQLCSIIVSFVPQTPVWER